MKLYYDKRLSDPTYYVQKGFRGTDGRATTRNIKIIGKHSELLKITDDPITYCKDLIDKMNKEEDNSNPSYQINFSFNEKIDETLNVYSKSNYLNIGYFYLQDIYHKLNLDEFFSKVTINRRIKYDCDLINRFLAHSRVLDPRSKYGTFEHLDQFFEKPEIEYHNILRFLDVLCDNSSAYLNWLYVNSNNVVKRDNSIVYYDCSNFYTETEEEDEDVYDEITGELISYGLRKYGVSKEHRPNPIVEMGLLIDKKGIPISMCLHPGNTNEQITALPLEKEIINSLNNSKFIYCADAGLGSYNIRQFNSMGGRAFIITQSIKKLSKELQADVFRDEYYKLLSNDEPYTIKQMKDFDCLDNNNLHLYNDLIYKVLPADKAIELGLYEYKETKNGHRKVKATGNLPQIVIVTFSRKMAEYQRKVRNRQIERAKKALTKKDPEEIKKGNNDARRFLKRVVKTENGEEAKVSYELDKDKVEKEEKYDGFYAVATNLVDDDVKGILQVISNRYQIEEIFRLTKTNFKGRPMYVSTEQHIRGHFLSTYTALLEYKLLESQLNDNSTHITANNLIETLRNMNVIDEDIYYRSTYSGSIALDALIKYKDLGLDYKRYKPSDLKKKIKKITK